jgi:hypothetical protein
MPLATPYAYLVSFKLTQPMDKYEPLFDELRRSYRWWNYLPSTWIVLRYDALAELAPKLRPLIFEPDRLLIMPAIGPADGWMEQDAWKWINDHLPKAW